MDITGKILFINNEETPSESKPDFKTRTFGLDTTAEINGQVYESSVGFQTTNKKNELLDSLNIGDKVKVHFSVRGTLKEKEGVNSSPKNTKNMIIYTNLSAYNIEVLERAKVENNGVASSDAPKAKRPDVIPQGMAWDEIKGELVAEDDLPF